MTCYKENFIETALSCGALKFGTFKLKSGRISPYFFNAGKFNSGRALRDLTNCYAAALSESDLNFDMLFGPAYKGIPLVSGLAIALSEEYKIDIPYCFNRKEEKKHGEAGLTIGATLSGNVVIVDDVITAGTAIKESINLIASAGANVTGIIVGLDRKEKGLTKYSAIQEIQRDYEIPIVSIVDIDDIIQHVTQHESSENFLSNISEYREKFGVD